MNCKTLLIGCVSALLAILPKSLFSCGDGIDPYDYYTSFFNQYAADKLAFKPFYYTNASFLFDTEEPEDQTTILSKEWAAFTDNKASAKDCNQFVTQYAYKDIRNLYNNIENNTSLKLPDSVRRNTMTSFFLQTKDRESLGYILFAKQVQPYVSQAYDEWDPIKRDSLKINSLLKNGLQLYAAARTEHIKLRYAYQIIRLAHYNDRYADAIKYYDELIPTNKTNSVLQPMSLALKAGALFRLGNNKEAAYLFAKAFSQSNVKKVSNYLGFDWAVVKAENREAYLALCKNDEERANMLGLFLLGNPSPDLLGIKEVANLLPSAEMLTTLIVRELNKYEDLYLTPFIDKQEPTGNHFYYSTIDKNTDSVMKALRPGLEDFMSWMNEQSKSNKNINEGFLKVSAAYAAYMLQDYGKANHFLSDAKKCQLSQRVQDQWMLTNLLVNINETTVIDDQFEDRILPSLQWLIKKANKPEWSSNSESEQWGKFYRNLMTEVLAKRYYQQKNLNKELLAISSAAFMQGYNYNAVDFLRTKYNGAETEKLYNFLKRKQFTPFEAFLLSKGTIKIVEVADFAGTAYLRDGDYDKAISWLSKEPKQNKVIKKNPFIELLYDREERLSNDKVTTTKLAFAKEMLQLHRLTLTDKANASKHLYKLGLGYYNTTYYGYAWNLVAYYRSGSDGYYLPENATAFQKEYYGCYKAHDYFKKALETSTDKEFQAKCLFMMAKCKQKQIHKPQYSEFNYNWDLYDVKTKEYQKEFENNAYFPQLISQYQKTKFYKEAKTRCSYLRDFKN